MREPKFTPGPWSADPDHEPGMEWNWHIVRANAPHLRVCFMAKSDRSEANAHLIAAAPELYEALSLCVKSILEDLQLTGYDEDEALEHPALEAAFAALAKARGEDSK